MRPPGSSTGPSFGFGGGGAPTVQTGDYLVTLTVNGQVHRQKLRGVAVDGGGASGGRFVEDEEGRDR